jgi:hypothetical protein
VPHAKSEQADVLRCADADLTALLAHYRLDLILLAADAAIPGSYWGEPEAGLVGGCLYLRPDTPVHSALHEACHFVCMDDTRRAALHTDAGGEVVEENAVCYLQVLLAEHVPGMSLARMFADMDAWGYSFRLGSSRAWFEHDADDAREWLLAHQLITPAGQPTWQLRH